MRGTNNLPAAGPTTSLTQDKKPPTHSAGVLNIPV